MGRIPADSPADRIEDWKKYFSSLLNNPNAPSTDGFTPEPVATDRPPDIRTGPFDMDELRIAASQLKSGKQGGTDEISPDVLRLEELHEILLPILNGTYLSHSPPAEFLRNKIIYLPKKGDLSLRKSYRGITLMQCAAKLYNRMLLNRIRPALDPLLRPNQHGFRPEHMTLEAILALRRLIEEVSAHKSASLCAVFIDFLKAFDSISRPRLFAILAAYGVPEETVAAIRCLYIGSTSFVSTPDGDSDPFPVETGVLQGDTLAPFLFIIVVDYVLRTAFSDAEHWFPTCSAQRKPPPSPSSYRSRLCG